jgi:hypothetical protein
MLRQIIKIGSTHLLTSPTTNVSSLLDLLSECQFVEQKSYPKDSEYELIDDRTLEVKFVDARLVHDDEKVEPEPRPTAVESSATPRG